MQVECVATCRYDTAPWSDRWINWKREVSSSADAAGRTGALIAAVAENSGRTPSWSLVGCCRLWKSELVKDQRLVA